MGVTEICLVNARPEDCKFRSAKRFDLRRETEASRLPFAGLVRRFRRAFFFARLAFLLFIAKASELGDQVKEGAVCMTNAINRHDQSVLENIAAIISASLSPI